MYPDLHIKGNVKGLANRFLNAKPFPHILIKNILSPTQVAALRHAIESEPKTRWNTDLYQFWQTDDLKKSETPEIKEFVAWFSSLDTKESIQQITGSKVLGSVDMAGFVYEDTDYLLPHDDRMPGRRVAYILYLTHSKRGEGGALDLFESVRQKIPTGRGNPARKGNPIKRVGIKKIIIPVAGCLMLFLVSKKSFHQVSEMASTNPRITIGGWFNE